MTIEALPSVQPAGTIIIAQGTPAEVLDSGKVRIGGGVHFCWLTSEILHYLPGLLRFWPDVAC